MRRAVLVVFCLAAVTGCGQVPQTSPADNGAEPTGAEPTPVDSITVVIAVEPRNLDPGMSDFEVNRVSRNIVEGLVDRAPSGELVPQLALSWEQVDDLVWRFELREGVTFHNGEPFNADAAVFTFERLTNPDVSPGLTVPQLLPAMRAEAVDEYILEITTEEPVPVLPNLMYSVLFSEPGETGTDESIRDPVGTGPYQLTSWGVDGIVLEAYEGYWGGVPAVRRAELVWRDDSSVSASMVDTGEADIAAEIGPQDVELLADPSWARSVVISETPLLRPDPPCEALADNRVRQAIDQAIDRSALAESLLGGFAVPASQLFTPDVVGYNEDMTVTAHDPDNARALLEDAASDGVPLDTEVTLMTYAGLYDKADEVNEAISEMLNSVGMNTTTMALDVGAFQEANRLVPIPPDRCMIVHTSASFEQGDGGRPLAVWYSDAVFETCCDAVVDQLIAEANLLSGDDRQSAFEEIVALVPEYHTALIPLFHLESLSAASPSIVWTPRFDRVLLIKDIQIDTE